MPAIAPAAKLAINGRARTKINGVSPITRRDFERLTLWFMVGRHDLRRIVQRLQDPPRKRKEGWGEEEKRNMSLTDGTGQAWGRLSAERLYRRSHTDCDRLRDWGMCRVTRDSMMNSNFSANSSSPLTSMSYGLHPLLARVPGCSRVSLLKISQ